MTTTPGQLPHFRYHPDPVASGSVIPSTAECILCEQPRGHIYQGPLYTQSTRSEPICPWCIADGSANRNLNAEFSDAHAFDDEIPPEIVDEICTRTPGYSSWQTGQWLGCCEDAMAFMKPIGIDEIRSHHPTLLAAAMLYALHQLGLAGAKANQLVDSLSSTDSPTAYLFRCLHCHRYRLHIDFL